MKKRLLIALSVFLLCMLAVMPAMAADVFRFAEDKVQVYVDDTVTPELLQDGKFAEGEVTYSVKGKACTVDENGTVTGVSPGELYLTASLSQNGKVVKTTSTRIVVCRKVSKITLSTKDLQVYDADDEKILPLLKPYTGDEPAPDRVIVLPAGKGFWPRVTITPEDVANAHKKVTYEISDAGVLKFTNEGQLVALQPGDCLLTIRSQQSPEITEQFRVLVTQPVKKVVISAAQKTVAAGQSLQLEATITPDNATVQELTWNSRNTKIATVDENGIVTGVARGEVTIEAKTTDGTNLTATFYMNVTQDVTEITIQETEVNVAAKKSAPQLHVQVLPKNANNRKVTWSSSDESVATVNAYGSITGRSRGECIVTCTSVSNPEISASIPVSVIQPVTDIQFTTPQGLSFHIGDSRQLDWQVLPADASIQDVEFRSRNPKVAVVDQNGIVTGIAKGQADIEAKATDGSGKYRVYRVTILKPVQGINPMTPQYFAQIGSSKNVKATVYPSDASDQAILWSISDESVASIKSVGTSYGRVYGYRPGRVTVTAITQDGGYTATTEVIVDDFDGMVFVREAKIDDDNKIRMTFMNQSMEYSVTKVYFHVECFDTQGAPIVCNKDGVSTSFDGDYPLTLEPLGVTMHGRFNFYDYQETGLYGFAVITITGYRFENGAEGQDWWIPEDKQVRLPSTYSSHWGEPVPTTIPMPDPEENNG